MVPAEQDCSHKENFGHAIELFIKKVLHEEKPRDYQYIYLAPGGDYNVQKPFFTRPIDHLHQWEELLRVAELLPAGNINTPSTIQVEWFYMTFHKTDRVGWIIFLGAPTYLVKIRLGSVKKTITLPLGLIAFGRRGCKPLPPKYSLDLSDIYHTLCSCLSVKPQAM